jgi:glycosyltransferase involved in cell wall biosynthesis
VLEPRPSRLFRGDPWERETRALVRHCRSRPRLASADAVLAHFVLPDGFSAVGLARALGVPSLAIAWGDDVHAWPDRWPDWQARLETTIAALDVPIACSRRISEDANARLPRPRDDWEVVYAGVDLERFAPAADVAAERARAFADRPPLTAPGARVLLMLGQPVLAKGYVELLDAWRAVAPLAGEWHLVMAGGGWGNVDLERECRSRGISERAHWIGAQPAERIPALMRASDGFVLPSHNEGLSISVLEAMATGLPVVATDVGGHAEVLRDGESGWLVPARDVAALERALRELTGSAAERARRGSAARRAVATVIGTPRDNARRLAELLREAVAGRRRRPASAAPAGVA